MLKLRVCFLLSALLTFALSCDNCSDERPPLRTDCEDSDGDGICDEQEEEIGTDPDEADSDGDGILDGDEYLDGLDPLDRDSDGDGIPDGNEQDVGTDPLEEDEACVDASAQAQVGEASAVDIILAIDTSGSMQGEIDQVEENINVNFANIIGQSNIDYKIILLADYPPGPKLTMCIREPLTSSDCVEPLPDAPGSGNRFVHYDTLVDSHDAFEVILNTLDTPDPHGQMPNGWRNELRAGAAKTFLLISDDDPDTNNVAFENALYAAAPEHFGSTNDSNFVWHSIIGMVEKNPPTEPWLPGEAIVDAQCPEGSESSATEYQELSVRTGGLRFPLCNNDAFDVVFREIAQGVIDQVFLPCNLDIPNPPAGREIDDDNVVLVYDASVGGEEVLSLIEDQNACSDDASYYVGGGRVTLCPQTCSRVQADERGRLSLFVACVGDVPDDEPGEGEGEGEGGEGEGEGQCSEANEGCASSGDCCEPLVCASGTCIFLDG